MEFFLSEIVLYGLKTSPVVAIFLVLLKIIWIKYQKELESNKELVKKNEEYNNKLTKSTEEILNGLTSVIQSLEKQNIKNTEEIVNSLTEYTRKLQSNMEYLVDRVLKKIDKIEDEK